MHLQESCPVAERKKIGEILVELQLLTPAEVDLVLSAMRQRCDHAKFGQAAKDMGLIRDEHVLAALAVQMHLFPHIQEMSLRQLIGKLSAPIRTPAPIPVQKLRRRLNTAPNRA
jgi:hypothetical protein